MAIICLPSILMEGRAKKLSWVSCILPGLIMVCRLLQVTVSVITSSLLFCCSFSWLHFGLQFHPESIATCHGSKIFRNFRDITEDYWLRSRSSYIMERNAHYTGKQELFQVLSLHCCSCWINMFLFLSITPLPPYTHTHTNRHACNHINTWLLVGGS